MRWFLLLIALAGLAALGLRHLPPEWDPRAPLDLNAAPNLVTGLKLARLRSDPALCRAAFASSGIAVSSVPDRASETGCPITNALRLPGTLRTLPNTPFVTCPMAAAWVLFERNTVQPAAWAHLGQAVTGVRHLGTYACRDVNNAASGRRSQHATANAIDIAAFTRAGAPDVVLLRDWDADDAEARFLRAVRDGACRWFSAVLGPDYNAAHRDHFHLDLGRARVCR
jgi:hypothetical protein